MERMDAFLELIAALRGDNGCPWDKKQTLDSMSKYLTDEAREAVEAVEHGDHKNLCEELGDVLLIAAMMSRIAEERGLFTFEDVVAGIHEKIIRRHPHVFGDLKLATAEDVLLNWHKIKENEKRARAGSGSGD